MIKKLENKLTVIDFFCGAGGFSEGFRQMGYDIICGYDHWKPAVVTYNHNFNLQCSPKNILDFNNSIDEINDIPNTDIILGSPPCVSFSNSNKSGKADKSLGVKLTETFLKIIAFSLKYSNFKQLLIDFEAIKTHPTPELNSFIINNRYKKLFDKTVLPEIKKRKIGVEEFRKSMEQQQIYGEEAEKFVLKFETERLENKKEVDWVAEYVVNEGYDIASYNNIQDEQPNRFIEVKSYDGPKAYFYWSRNEYQVAKLKGNNYWLYLVNRSKLKTEGYEPEKYQDPFNTILGDHNIDWIEEVDKYKITANA